MFTEAAIRLILDSCSVLVQKIEDVDLLQRFEGGSAFIPQGWFVGTIEE
jgi:hypothetical protein